MPAPSFSISITSSLLFTVHASSGLSTPLSCVSSLDMAWSCLICGWRQLDSTQPPQHTCGHASNALFAIPDGHVSPMIAFDPQPSPTFNSTTRIPFIATQHSPRPSMWLTDRYTDPVPPIVQASTDQSPFHDGFQSQETTFRYPQPEPLQTSHEEHVSRRVGQTLRSPASSTQVPSE